MGRNISEILMNRPSKEGIYLGFGSQRNQPFGQDGSFCFIQYQCAIAGRSFLDFHGTNRIPGKDSC
jgi:hypothetical protein